MSFLPFSSSPASNFLNAFERSFESFLQSSSSVSPHGQSYNQNDPNSKESISAIISTVNPNLAFSFGQTPPFVQRSRSYTTNATPTRLSGTLGSPTANIDLTNRNGFQADTMREARKPKTEEEVAARSFSCNYCKKSFRKETTFVLHQCPLNNTQTHYSESPRYGKRFMSKQSPNQPRRVSESEELPLPKPRRTSTAPSVKTSRPSNTDRVEIEVPVTLVNTEIVFQELTGRALIMGDIIELDPQDISYEEALTDGTQIETLSSSRSVVMEVKLEGPSRCLPDAGEQMAKDSGLSLQELDDIFSQLQEDSQESRPVKFAWQKQETTDAKEKEKKCLTEDTRVTLSESYVGLSPRTPANVSAKKRSSSVSLQKFTYFNDSPQTVVLSEEESDEDWTAKKIKCKPCKKLFPSKTQYRKHLKTHSKVKKIVSSSKGPQKCLEKMLTLEEF